MSLGGFMTKNTAETGYLDILRFIAICLVIYMHSGSIGLHAFENSTDGFTYWFGIYSYPIIQICVPLFFMISGALLLTKQESIREILRKRILRMIGVLLLAICIQYAYLCMTNPISPSLEEGLKALYTGGIITQQWFFYAYLSMLFVLPFLQKLAPALSEKDFIYLLVLQILLHSIFPMVEALTDWGSTALYVPFLENIIFYPLIGYYCAHKMTLLSGTSSRLLLYLTAFLTSLFHAFMNHHSWVHGQRIAYGDLFTYLYAIALFCLIKALHARIGNTKIGCPRFWSFCRNGIFGTYILENILREAYLPLYHMICGNTFCLPVIILWVLAVVMTGIILTNLLKLIPGLKKLL